MSRLFIGTSGWSYPHWQGIFYPKGLSQGRWLEHYAKFFNCVELNVTFYRLITKKTFQNWHERTPKEFYFVAKGSRFITHIKRLKGIKESLGFFIDGISGLKEKLLAILWQLPPSFKKDLKRLEAFLRLLKKTDIRQAFEFRHSSWFDEDLYNLLKKYNLCLSIAHSSSFPCPVRTPVSNGACIKEITSDFIYLRFHGGGSLYSSNYSGQDLREWAEFTKNYKNKDIFAFFNNDASGYAVKNALKFKDFLEE